MGEFVQQKCKRVWQYLSQHRVLSLSAVFIIASILFWQSSIGTVLAQSGGAVTGSAGDSFTGIGGAILYVLTHALLAVTRLFLSLTVFLLTFIIEIAGYNGYLKASAVNVGWVMVRDLANMLFIVALLAIAIATILGAERYEWKHMLVELVVAAVLVNFSRTICGVIIDAAQVVMNTFVNGIAATAAGNVINAFGLNGILQISQNTPGQNLTDYNLFLAAFAGVFFSSMVMCVLAMFVAMLLIRMVTLWILIVLSPLGFVLRILPDTEHYAQEWWSELFKNVITGPVLLFFIWLSFVAVGNGRINQDEILKNNSVQTFAQEGSTSLEKSSGISKFLDWNSMANFAIAIGMLIVGAETAQHLGGKGGSLAEKGIHWGQHVAEFGSGMFIGHWAAHQVAHNVEQKYENVKDKVVGIGTTGIELANNIRDQYLQDAIKAADEVKGPRGAILKTLAGAADFAFRSSTRSKSIAEKYKEMGEAAHELHENRLSTSPSTVNDKVRELEGRAHLAKRVKDATGRRKKLQMEVDLANRSGRVQKDLQKLTKETVEGDVLQRVVQGEEDEMIGARQHALTLAGEQDSNLDKLEELQREQSRTDITDERRAEITNELGVLEAKLAATTTATVPELQRERDLINDREGGRTLTDAENKELAAIQAKTRIPDIVQDAEKYADLANRATELEEQAKQYKTLNQETENRRSNETKDDLMRSNADFQQRENFIAAERGKNQKYEELFNNKRQIELLAAIRNLLENNPEFQRLQDRIFQGITDKDNAQLEHDREQLNSRAVVARRNGNIVLASTLEQQARSLETNKMQEAFKAAGMNANERAFLGRNLAQQIQNARSEYSTFEERRARGEVLSADENRRMEAAAARERQMVKQRNALSVVNANLTSYDAQQDMRQTLDGIGWNEAWSNQNKIRRILSMNLGQVVAPGGEQEAVRRLEERLGAETFNAVMRQLGTAAKSQTEQNNHDFIGAFEEHFDPRSGRVTYRFTTSDRDDADNIYRDAEGNPERRILTAAQQEAKSRSTYEDWRAQGAIAIERSTQAAGTRSVDGNTLINLTENDIHMNAELLQGWNANRIGNLKGGLLGDLDNMQVTERNRERILQQLTEFARAVNDRSAYDALLKKISKLINQLATGEGAAARLTAIRELAGPNTRERAEE